MPRRSFESLGSLESSPASSSKSSRSSSPSNPSNPPSYPQDGPRQNLTVPPHVDDNLVHGLRRRSFSQQTRPPLPTLPSPAPSQKWQRGDGFWRSFIAICLPLLLSALEGSVTNTALPTISEALKLGTMFSWAATSFLLSSTIFQPLYGQLGDMWGRKYPMMVAIAIFAIGSAICGAANSGATLIFGRIVQGLGTGGIDLFSEIVLCDMIPLRQRGPYLSIKHIVYATGTCVGPVLGGVFAEHGWRWCFLINIPVCAIALMVMWFWLQVGGGIDTKEVNVREELAKVDFKGTTILTISVVMVCVSLSIGGAPLPWHHPSIIVPLVFGILGLLAFPCYERSKWCRYPMMPRSIFTNRTTIISYIITIIHGFITYGFQFYLPPFFQAVKGSSPSQSGLQVLPTTLAIVVVAAAGGPVLKYWGKYKPIHIVGFASMTLGLGLCILMTKTLPIGGWLMFQLLFATGSGMVVPTMLPAVQVKLAESTTGVSSGAWAFLRGTGSLFGVALPGALFNMRFSQLLPTITSSAARSQLSSGQAYERASADFIRAFAPEVQSQIIHAFTEALKSVWIVFTIMAGLGFIIVWGEKQYRMREELNTQFGLKINKSAVNTPAVTPAATRPTSPDATAVNTPVNTTPTTAVNSPLNTPNVEQDGFKLSGELESGEVTPASSGSSSRTVEGARPPTTPEEMV